MNSSGKKTTLLIVLTISILSSLLTIGSYLFFPNILSDIDARLSDIRFQYRGVNAPNPDVVIVAIDEKSVNEIGRWPWSRSEIAKLVDKFYEYDVKTAVFDIVFSEPESAKSDSALGASIKNSENVVLGFFFRKDSTAKQDPESVKLHRKSKIGLVKHLDGNDKKTINEFPSAEYNIPLIASNTRDFGFFNVIPDDDGIYRHAPLIVSYKGNFYPSLNLKGASKHSGKQILLTLSDFGISTVNLNDISIPVDENGRLLLNYYGESGTFPIYSAVDVLNGVISKEKLENKIVFVGATELGIADIRATPFDPVSPGVEIQATAASNILDGNFLIKDGFTEAIDIGIIFLLTFIFGLVLYKANKTLIGLLVLLIFIALHLGSNFFLFTKSNMVQSILFPLLPLVFTYIMFEVYRNFFIEKQSRFLKGAFSSYVSPDVVDEIIKNPDKLQLGGDRRKITLLFSDIRGFTTLSEKTDPEKLVTLLNEYLSPMTEIVMKNKGTLDKFIGDAVMAIYGAPVKQDGQALHACISAVEMIEKLRQINIEWTKNNLPNIDIGIGINTGEAVVGNMGANIRFDYTAIGDTVNLAARLEGQTKFYGVNIIISESTKLELEQMPEVSSVYSFRFRELDLIRVKGKIKPIAIFQLIVPGDNLDNNKIIDNYNTALSNYRNRNFAESLGLFKLILNELPGDVPSGHYVERCNNFLINPPSADWDYVYTAETK